MKTWNFVDKSAWPEGVWRSEPDKIQWIDEATGLDCLIVRNSGIGNLCGYVGVPELHPAFKKDYDNLDVDVHGGLTFADVCQEGGEHGICHVPEPGRPHLIWWLGFDAAHCYDLLPAHSALFAGLHTRDVYRDFAYMQAECASLAAQLAAMV